MVSSTRINETIQKQSTNDTKHSTYKYKYYQNTHTIVKTTSPPHTHTPNIKKTSHNNHSTRYTPNEIVTIMCNIIACNPQFYNNGTDGLQMDAFVYYNLLSFVPGEYLLNTDTFLTAVALPWLDNVSDGLCYRAAPLVLAARCDREELILQKKYVTSVSVCSAT